MSEPLSGAQAPPCLDAQLIVSLAIIAAQTVLGCTLIGVAVYMQNWQIAAAGGVGTIIGSLSTALNAPSGTANALKALKGGQG